MKTYSTDPSLTLTDREERALLGDEPHHGQAHMYVIAKTKKAAVEFLVATGKRPHVAESVMKHARVVLGVGSNAFRAAVAAGVIDPETPGAYLFSMNLGNGVVSLTVDGPVRVATDLTRRGTDADRFRLDTPQGSQ